MKIFIIGGTSCAPDESDWAVQCDMLGRNFEILVETLCGHELIICSPFKGSADRAILDGLINNKNSKAQIEIHYPSLPNLEKEIELIERDNRKNANVQIKKFAHPQPVDSSDQAYTNAWLFAQLYALERSHVILAIGGRIGGSSELLLQMAEVKRKPILPIPQQKGTAGQWFWKKNYVLQSALGDEFDLSDPHSWIDTLVSLTNASFSSLSPSGSPLPTFFISYSRKRPEEADLVETILRRRNCLVFRDEQDFEPGNLIESEIRDRIAQASIFIALHCCDYVCSPWCFDELSLAAERASAGNISIWLVMLDDTRIVHPQARGVVTIPASSRIELESRISSRLEGYI